MGIFGGPSNQVLNQMALGIASVFLQHRMLSELDDVARNEAVQKMKEEGSPVDRTELVKMVSEVINEEKLGWHSRSKFLTMIYGHLVSAGLSTTEAFNVREDIRNYYKLIGSR